MTLQNAFIAPCNSHTKKEPLFSPATTAARCQLSSQHTEVFSPSPHLKNPLADWPCSCPLLAAGFCGLLKASCLCCLIGLAPQGHPTDAAVATMCVRAARRGHWSGQHQDDAAICHFNHGKVRASTSSSCYSLTGFDCISERSGTSKQSFTVIRPLPVTTPHCRGGNR